MYYKMSTIQNLQKRWIKQADGTYGFSVEFRWGTYRYDEKILLTLCQDRCKFRDDSAGLDYEIKFAGIEIRKKEFEMSENPNNEVTVEYRDYGIDEYVPMEARYYSVKDMASVWICANANPTSWYMGTIVGALGLGGAFLSAVIGNPLVYLILALVGLMGFRVASSTMGLARVPFGIVGSKLPSFINALQFVGWCGVNTYIAAIPLSSLISSVLGTDPYSNTMIVLSVLIILGVTSAIAVYGGAKLLGLAQNIAMVCLVVLSIWIAIQLFRTFSFSDIAAWNLADVSSNLDWEISFGYAIDSFAAFGFAWVMAAADYTRYTKNEAAAVGAPLLGATFGMLWFCMIGAISAIAVAVKAGGVFDPMAADLSYICAQLGMGQVANLLIVISTIAVNMINIYSGGFSTANVSEKLAPKLSMGILSVLSAILALTPLLFGNFLDTFQIFLGYLGAVFPPCIAIMVVDYFLIRKQQYDITQFSRKDGPYWYKNGVNPVAIICFAVGVISYFIGQRIPFVMATMGAVFFCFLITGVIYYLAAKVAVRNV